MLTRFNKVIKSRQSFLTYNAATRFFYCRNVTLILYIPDSTPNNPRALHRTTIHK